MPRKANHNRSSSNAKKQGPRRTTIQSVSSAVSGEKICAPNPRGEITKAQGVAKGGMDNPGTAAQDNRKSGTAAVTKTAEEHLKDFVNLSINKGNPFGGKNTIPLHMGNHQSDSASGPALKLSQAAPGHTLGTLTPTLSTIGTESIPIFSTQNSGNLDTRFIPTQQRLGFSFPTHGTAQNQNTMTFVYGYNPNIPMDSHNAAPVRGQNGPGIIGEDRLAMGYNRGGLDATQNNNNGGAERRQTQGPIPGNYPELLRMQRGLNNTILYQPIREPIGPTADCIASGNRTPSGVFSSSSLGFTKRLGEPQRTPIANPTAARQVSLTGSCLTTQSSSSPFGNSVTDSDGLFSTPEHEGTRRASLFSMFSSNPSSTISFKHVDMCKLPEEQEDITIVSPEITSGQDSLLVGQKQEVAGSGRKQAVRSNSQGSDETDTRLSPVFHPMQAVLVDQEETDVSERATALVAAEKATDVPSDVFSENYRGERSTRNRSAQITDKDNCSLWITNLPATVTYRELLSGIRNMGRIYATVINPPDPNQGHTTSAAKIVFFERNAAHRFFVWANQNGLEVGGSRARVSWNRIKSSEQPESGHKSRVLVLTGLSEYTNEKFLTDWFKSRFKFELDEVVTHIDTGSWAKIEYRFGSYRCQSQAAKMALTRELRENIWEVRFGRDPCASDHGTLIENEIHDEDSKLA